jgi:putative aldouronate transport system substrate-binding protein
MKSITRRENIVRLAGFFTIVVMLLTACGGSAPSAITTSAPATDEFANLDLVIPDKYDPPIEMHSVITVDATVKFLGDDTIDSNVWTRAYQQLLGINLTFDWAVDPSLYDQKLTLSVSSGDIPDMFHVTASQLLLFQEAGLLTDLTDVYETYASDGTRDILTQDPVALRAATIDGKLWGIPMTDASINSANLLWVRQDWMDKLGIDAPTSMQDVLEISHRFSNDDPDGNGLDDTIGLCMNKSLYGSSSNINGFMNGFHAYPNIWYERDGKLVYGSVQPEIRDGLLALQEMYTAGEIDPEFGVKDVNAVNETIAQGKCGMEFGIWWNPYFPLNLSQQNDPTAFWSPFMIPSIDDTPAKTQYTSAIGAFLVVRNGYEHPEALMRMVNFWVDNFADSEDDAVRNTFLGNLDAPDVVLYKYNPVILWVPNAAIEGGKALRAALASGDPSGLNLDGLWRYRIIQAYFEQGILEAWVEVATNGPGGASSILEKILEGNGQLNRFYGPPTETMAQVMPTLQSMQDEVFIKIIMGDPISNFDKFVQDWYDLGGTQIVDEVNQWAKNNPLK